MSALYYATGDDRTASDYAREICKKAGQIRMANPNDKTLIWLLMLQIGMIVDEYVKKVEFKIDGTG